MALILSRQIIAQLYKCLIVSKTMSNVHINYNPFMPFKHRYSFKVLWFT